MAITSFLRSIPFIALVFFARITPGGVQSFEIVANTNQVRVGESMPVTIRGLNSDSIVETNFTGELPLQLFSRAAPGIVISEIETTNHVVELVNTSTQPVDLSDWDFTLADNSSVNAHWRFPTGFVAQPLEIFLLSKDPITNATVRVLYPATPPRQWLYGVYTLRDQNGNIVDQISVGFVDAISLPAWKGSTLVTRPGPWARSGADNHFNSNDWSAVTVASRGVVNPGLQLPWAGPDILQRNQVVQFTNGVWSGNVLFNIAPGSAVLTISDDLNHRGSSDRISVEALPALSLTFESSVQQASEDVAGPVGKGFVGLPSPSAAEVQVTLSSSDTNELRVPSGVVIPAGELSVSFVITNLDDALVDGAAMTKISAAAAGYADGEAILVNRDNEAGQLYVILPATANEDTGFQASPGRVFISGIAQRDILVHLRSDSILRVPQSIVVAKGKSSGMFQFAVDNDDLYSTVFKARVWARTDNWPEAVGTIQIIDNDDPNMLFTAPDIIWEGEPGEGVINLNTARHTDTEFAVRADQFGVPAKVIIPAGVTEIRFPITFLVPGTGRIFITQDFFSLDHFVTGLPAAANIANLVPGFARGAVFSGEKVQINATLADLAGTPQHTNVTGEIRLLGPAGVSFVTQSIQFTNGLWSGEVTVNGSGTGAQFELAAAGFTNQTRKFDVVTGGLNAMTALDMAWHSRSNLLIVSEGPATNSTGRLVVLDPRNPTNVLNTLDLPAPATAISLSEDETVAWMILANNRFQKVDLAQWALAGSFPVSTNSAEIARDVLVLPGGTGTFVAVVGPNSNQPQLSRVQLFENGVANTNTASIPNFGGLSAIDLVRGHDASEFLLQQPWRIARYTAANGVTLGGDAAVGGAPNNTVYADGFVYNGTAGILDPTTLAIDNRFGFAISPAGLVFPFPEISRLYGFYQSQIATYDLGSGEQLGSSSIDNLFDGSGMSKAIRTSNGFAFIVSSGVVSFASPFIQTTQPDLSLNFIGPIVQTNKVQYANEPFQWEVEAINNGPGPAPGVIVRFGDFGGVELGQLEVGEHRRVKGPILNAPGGIVQAIVKIFSALVDPNPANNQAFAQTQVRSALQFPGFEIPMAATSLVSSPDRTRLYAGFSTLPGITGPGVAIIDPDTATVERVITGPGAPKILAVSADNQYLYGLTATNEVTRWNLQNGAIDASIRFTNETVLHMVAPPTGTGRIVIATDKKVAVYDGDTALSGRISRAANFRWLGFSGPDLWLSETGQLYRLGVSDNGVGLNAGPIALNLFTGNYQFYADSRRLYFDSYNFDLTMRTLTGGGVRNGLLLFPESDVLLELFGNHARAYAGASLTLLADDLIPFAAAGDSARFGDRGVAVIAAAQQLVLYKVSSAPLGAPPADLQLSVTPPAAPYSLYPLEWQFTVHNNSANPALNARLILDRPPELRDPTWDPASAMTVFYSSSFDLGTLDPGASAIVKLNGNSFGGNLSLAAHVVSNSPDPNTNNNSYTETRYFQPPPGDLVMTGLTGPTNAVVGDQVLYSFSIHNAGQIDVPAAFVELHLGDGVDLPDGIPAGVSLAAGESKTVDVRMKLTRAGLIQIAGTLTGNITDAQSGNNSSNLMVFVKDASAPVGTLAFPGPRLLAWSEARQEIIASFPDAQWSLFGLDPKTLEPRWSVLLNYLPALIAPTDDGRYVWVALAGGGIDRVDLQTGAIDINFNISPTQAQVWAIRSPPGHPETVLVAFDPGFTGQNRVQVFVNGLAQPTTFNGAGNIVFTSSGRGFISNSQLLREFKLTTDGLAEVNNFDSLAPWGASSVTTVDDTFYYSTGRMLNIATSQIDDRFADSAGLATDAVVRQAYRMSFTNLAFGREYFLENFDITAAQSQWKIPLTESGSLLTMGTNGVLVSGASLNIYKVDSATKAADLAVGLDAPAALAGPGVEFTLNIAVTNLSLWKGENAQLSLTLAPGTSVLQSGIWVETNDLTIALGLFEGTTNLSFELKQKSAGDALYQATVSTSTADPNVANNSAQALVTTAPAPQVLVDDVAQAENAPFTAFLSSPAASELRVDFTAAPLNADASDINLPTGYFVFSPGSTSATAQIVTPDSTPELDESIVVNFTSDTASLIRTQAVVTVLNDDLPRLTITPPASVPEGNVGTKLVTIPLALTAAPFASEVEYETVSGSAIAGRDFIAQSGRVRFAPGETSKAISVEIIGNTNYEATKTFSVALKNPTSLAYLNSSAAVTVSIRNDDPPPPFPSAISVPNATSLGIRFEAVANILYQLETRTNLAAGTWSSVFATPQIAGTNGQFTIPKPTSSKPVNFYRIKATPN